jgi:transposase-like protein
MSSLLVTPTCPHCHSPHRQPKWGRTKCGSQMHRCHDCQRTYTPAPKTQGHPDALRRQAVRMSLDGINQRRVGRLLSVNQQSVGNWLKAYHEELAAQHPDPPQPARAETVELDELYTFVGSKKVASMSARR